MRVLFETHIAKATLDALAKIAPEIEAEHLARWKEGELRNAADADILAACHEDKRVLVTFDLRTIPDLLRHWAAEGRDHSGVVFADADTVKPNRPADVAVALRALADEIGSADTQNMIRFLRPPSD